ncbi:MAG TPA: heme o synthase [Anaerolineales bacterium]|nr:heme o synthase [Anaerolineales bacterium]
MQTKALKSRISEFQFFAISGFFLFSFLFRNDLGNAECVGAPLCWGNLVFLIHRSLVVLLSAFLLWHEYTVWRQHREDKRLLLTSTTLLVLFLFEVIIGYSFAILPQEGDFRGLHAITSISILLMSGYVYLVAQNTSANQTTYEQINLRQRVSDVITLTKPVIVMLLLTTTVAGMFFAEKGMPDFQTLIATMLGGILAAGGSGAINQYLDANLDKEMQRTAGRPIPAGRIYPAEVLAIGVAFCLISLYLFFIFVNPLSTLLTFFGMVYYVYIYSVLLKKATTQNIVIGGGAGAIPAVIGWTAVTGSLAWPAIILFAIIFMWTPPHFWALAIVRQKDYARASVPMLPVVKGEEATRKAIFEYSIVLVLTTLLLPIFRYTGWIFLIGSTLLGIGFLWMAWRVKTIPGNKVTWQMYKFSSYYLLLIFLILIVDSLYFIAY